TAARELALVHVAVRIVLRDRPQLRHLPPQRALRAPLPRALAGDLPRRSAARRLQPVPARAERDRPNTRTGGLGDLLRPQPGPPPRQRSHRLGPRRARLRRAPVRQPRAAAAQPAPPRGHLALLYPHGFRARARRLPGLGVLGRADARAERLVSPTQPRPEHPRAVSGGRRDAPGGRAAGGDQLGQGHRQRGARRSQKAGGGMNAALAPLPLEAEAAHVIAQHSKSFALASRILPRACRAEVHVLYAWCRRADDLVDLQGAACARRAVLLLGRELDGVYAGRRQDQPLLAAFQRVVLERSVPREYPAELIAGLSMDAEGTRYETLGDLHRYCYRVAGTVGLMMAHVLGARD